jgi:signal transduction histidine kinase/ABC-type multidrug transport system ATPase subunit
MSASPGLRTDGSPAGAGRLADGSLAGADRPSDQLSAVALAPVGSAPELLALEVGGVSKSFGRNRVLDGVDLVVRPGEVVGLVGGNGAGKTTLVRCIAGALNPDAGTVSVPARSTGSAGGGGLAVVWQDLALCDNLDVVANLFLGRERGTLFLSDAAMHSAARAALAELGVVIDDLRRPVSLLSRGQRQLVAIARALLSRPRVLVLDEPTASLGVAESAVVDQTLQELRDSGVALLLVSHRVEEVLEVADRVAVLRQGRLVADVLSREVHRDDVVALISGVETDSTARRQLHRFRSLVDQLAEVEPAASLPLIVSALPAALGVEQLCVHLVADGEAGAPPVLVRRAAVGVPAALLARNGRVPIGAVGGLVGLAAERGVNVVTDDVRIDPAWAGARRDAVAAGVLSAWAVPVIGNDGVLGVISAYGTAVGRPQPDQLELVSLYTSLAAAAIERERLLDEVTRRNQVLETLRAMLEILAGPQHVQAGMARALLALCHGLGADAVALFDDLDDHAAGDDHDGVDGGDVVDGAGGPRGAGRRADLPALRAATTATGEAVPEATRAALAAVAAAVLGAAGEGGDVRLVDAATMAARLDLPEGRFVLVAHWTAGGRATEDARALLADASRSLRLAVEREHVETAHKEAEALRRSNSMQREFLGRLSHELRTPLTAIQGYASTLRQPDVTWDAPSQARFLELIMSESARMSRLVAGLLDTSTLEAGGLSILPHWCDLPLVVQAAIAVVPGAGEVVAVTAAVDVPLVWADHDRLEQVFVNLVDNALRHGLPGAPVRVAVTLERRGGEVHVVVADDGPGIPDDIRARAFVPYVRGATAGPGAGLGLAISRGIVDAHGGRIWLEHTPPGAGTRIHFVVPVEPADDQETRAHA